MNDPKAPKPGEDTKAGMNRKERLRREKATLEAWFQRHDATLPVLDRPATIADLRDLVREKIQQFLRGHEK